MKTYLRTKQGVILPDVERLRVNKELTLVTEQEAFPEKFAPVDLAKREKKIDLDVPKDAAVAPPFVAPELTADASRAFGGPKAAQLKYDKVPADRPSKPDFTGLVGEI